MPEENAHREGLVSIGTCLGICFCWDHISLPTPALGCHRLTWGAAGTPSGSCPCEAHAPEKGALVTLQSQKKKKKSKAAKGLKGLHFLNLITGPEDPFRSGSSLISTRYKTVE